jgi:transcriptional regulator with XRE-family HTH domain
MRDMMTEPRTLRLRRALGESQDAFAIRLGATQGTVWRLERGQPETGAQRILLDQIENGLIAQAFAAANAAGIAAATEYALGLIADQPVSPGAVPPAPPAALSEPARPAGAAFSSEVQP